MTEALRVALEAMRRGELVSDDTVVGIVTERLHCLRCTYGFLLDGFPRTIEQAIELENLLAASKLELDAVVDYVLDTEEIVARLSGRRTCRGCKATFHVVSKPPQVDGICDLCGGELFQRDDDSPESIQVRLEAYEKSTKPLKDFFKGKVVSVSADGSPEEIFDRTLEAFSHRGIL
jgi:adenylate kinase